MIPTIRQGAWISPGGVKYEFEFEDALERSQGLKGAEHQHPFQDIPEVVTAGLRGNRLPFTFYLQGDGYLARSNALYIALGEPGLATLQHPIYGNYKVKCLDWTQKTDVVKGIGQSIFSCEFIEATELKFPVTTKDPVSAASAAGSAMTDGAAASYGKKLKKETAEQKSNIASIQTKARNSVDKFLGPLRKLSDDVTTLYTSTLDTIDNALDPVDDAVDVYYQVRDLIALPGRVQTIITAKIQSYQNLLDEILGNGEPSGTSAVELNTANQTALFGAAVDAALNESVFYCVFSNRGETIAALAALDAAHETLTGYLDSQHDKFDTGNIGDDFAIDADAMTALSELREITQRWLIDKAFSLPARKIYTTETDRHPIELYYEIYGTLVDSDFDAWCAQNHIAGDEFFLIPAGRVLEYYV